MEYYLFYFLLLTVVICGTGMLIDIKLYNAGTRLTRRQLFISPAPDGYH